jgi:hypothetical protein
VSVWTGRRSLAALAALAAVLAVAIVMLVINLPGGGASQEPTSPPVAVSPNAAAPAMPAKGAYFGAWVGPAVFTQPGRIQAVDALQQQIGRRLDIVHIYLQQDGVFPTSSDLAFVRQGSMLLVSWALNDSRGIAAGQYDAAIRQRAGEIKAIGRPVFLEWRWEMDRPNLRAQVGSAADYIAAWKHIRRLFAQQHADNVAWVWCPSARGFTGGYAGAYYPGNAQVDWVCADAYPGGGSLHPFADVVRPFLAWASHHPKPIMIGEYGVPQRFSPQERAQWLRGAARTIMAYPRIKAAVYFDGPGVHPGSSFMLDAGSLQAFRGIAHSRYFNPREQPPAQG